MVRAAAVACRNRASVHTATLGAAPIGIATHAASAVIAVIAAGVDATGMAAAAAAKVVGMAADAPSADATTHARQGSHASQESRGNQGNHGSHGRLVTRIDATNSVATKAGGRPRAQDPAQIRAQARMR